MSEISDYLNDLFSGRKPIRRENPKHGQSGWYYMMPKSDDDYTDYDFIDVPDENTPNPRLQQSMVNQTQTPVLSSAIPAAGNWGSPVPTPTPAGKYIVNDSVRNESYGFNNIYASTENTFNKLYQTTDNAYAGNFRTPQNNFQPDWGKQTQQALDDYIQRYNPYSGQINTGILAPIYDMIRNHQDMKNLQLIGADKFFHCKANYEAAKRGNWGSVVGKMISFGREIPWGLIKDGLQDSYDDWYADQKGWNGAYNGLTLQDSCSTNPRNYYK